MAGLRDMTADKVALFNDLEAIAATYPGFQALVQTVQNAIFSADSIEQEETSDDYERRA